MVLIFAKMYPINMTLITDFIMPLLLDAGGPLLLIINLYLFILGQVWIIISEYIYLTEFVFKNKLSNLKIFLLTFEMNLTSTIIGAFLFPLFLALIGYIGLKEFDNTTFGNILSGIGTWIIGDHTPYPTLVFISTLIGFIITLILTVFIENKIFFKYQLQYLNETKKQILIKTIIMNSISYSGLIIIYVLFM
jgi:hypothetical protein